MSFERFSLVEYETISINIFQRALFHFFGFIGVKLFFHNFDQKTPQKNKVYCSLEPYFHNLLA